MNFSPLILRRIPKISDASTHGIDSIPLKEVFESLSQIDCAVATTWVKAISNGWYTSWRMSEEVKLPCIYGCFSEKDDIRHYLDCPVLLSIVHEHSRTPLGPDRIHRLNLARPSPVTAVQLAMMYNAYHTAKIGHREETLRALSTRVFAPTVRIANSVCEDVAAKYGTILNINVQKLSIENVDPMHGHGDLYSYIHQLDFHAPLNLSFGNSGRPVAPLPRTVTIHNSNANMFDTNANRTSTTFVPAAAANAHNPFIAVNPDTLVGAQGGSSVGLAFRDTTNNLSIAGPTVMSLTSR